jgi:ferredoxin-NADP reductase
MSHEHVNFRPSRDAIGRSSTSDLSFVASKDVLCICMQIGHDVLQDAIINGCKTVKAVSARTGAGTVCGGCVTTIATMTGERLWQTAVCAQVVERTPQVRSFRIETIGQQSALIAQPGQHVMLKVTIDSVVVCRPYTVTACANSNSSTTLITSLNASSLGSAVYEITVLRQAHGAMSNWLFDNMRANTVVSIAPPSGENRFLLTGVRPLVFLVGGIGITPALAFCRALSADQSMRPIHVEYSASTLADVVCGEELKYLASRMPTFTLSLRITSEKGRLSLADICTLANQCVNAEWFICGTQSFEHDIKAMLLAADVDADDIHVESFTARPDRVDAVRSSIGTASANLTAWLSPAQRAATSSFALLVIGGYLIQGIARVHWPALVALHASTTVNIFTGVLLAILFIFQGQLGWVRAKNEKSSFARVYGKHILLGPLPLVVLWLHSTTLGTALTFWLTLSLLASLATGAMIGMRPRSIGWESVRRCLLGAHIFLSCATCGLGIVHGLIAIWF